MTSYPISFPNYAAPNAERFTLNRRQSVTESPWTYAVQTVDTAAQWQLQWSWPRMRLAQAERIAAWGLSLKGQHGSFRYYPRQFSSTLTGRSLALPGYTYQDTISATGWGAGAATELRPGQWFSIGDQLLRLIDAPTTADANGRVTISFEPFLRVQYVAGTGLNFTAPSGVFRLNDSNGIAYTLDPDKLPDFGAIQAREVVG